MGGDGQVLYLRVPEPLPARKCHMSSFIRPPTHPSREGTREGRSSSTACTVKSRGCRPPQLPIQMLPTTCCLSSTVGLNMRRLFRYEQRGRNRAKESEYTDRRSS